MSDPELFREGVFGGRGGEEGCARNGPAGQHPDTSNYNSRAVVWKRFFANSLQQKMKNKKGAKVKKTQSGTRPSQT